jgi:sulfite oxidase
MRNPFRTAPPGVTIDNPRLITHSQQPYNAEPPTDQLRASFITQQSGFYVRSHGNIPELDPAVHRLRVTGHVGIPLDLSLEELRGRFSPRTVMATIQCAGNRRADMQRVRPTSGDPWAPGAIGNAEWTGVSLADVLRAAGAEEGADLHVAFDCADECKLEGKNFRYGASIPMAKALCPEVLLAYAMNGESLKAEHGAPLRVVVPGYAGVRSPKWLHTVTVQNAPSENPIQADDYKLFPSHVTQETADPSRGVTINRLPLNSAICEPAAHAQLPAGPVTLRGYATVSDRAVVRVDVSPDGGRSWSQAELEDQPGSAWSWIFWRATLDIPQGEHELAVRAWDDAGQTQPALPDDTWNFKGYLSAAWHRVPVLAV